MVRVGAWEDFDTYFSPEKSPLPLYGNVVTLFNEPEFTVSPRLFTDSVQIKQAIFSREEYHNRFYLHPKVADTIAVPFITKVDITQHLLQNALGKEVLIAELMPPRTKRSFEWDSHGFDL